MTKLPFLDVSVSGRVRSIAAGISVSNLPPPRRLPRPTLSRPASPTEDGAWAPPVQEIQLILPTLWSAYIRLNSHPRWLWLAKQPKCIFIAKTYCVAWLVVEAREGAVGRSHVSVNWPLVHCQPETGLSQYALLRQQALVYLFKPSKGYST